MKIKHLNIQISEDLYDKLILIKGRRTWIKFFEDITNEGPRISGK